MYIPKPIKVLLYTIAIPVIPTLLFYIISNMSTKALEITGTILLIWFIQLVVAVFYNIHNETRTPRGFFDLVILLFLPYIIVYKDEIK